MYQDFENQYTEPKHSGIGIASFVISLLVVLGVLGTFGYTMAIAASAKGELDENSPQAILIGLLIIGLGLVDLLAIGFGIAGMVQSNRKKLFAILGTIIAVGTILGVLALAAIGNSMQ